MARGIELYANREPQHIRTWTLAALILILAFFFIGGVLAELLINVPGMREIFPKSTWQNDLFPLVFAFGFAALICFAWIKFFEKRSLATIGFIPDGWLLYGRGLLYGFGFISTVVGSIYLLGGYQIEASGISNNFSIGAMSALIFLFFGFAIQGATEEIFFEVGYFN